MSALWNYVAESQRQADLLEAAATFDDACLQPEPPDFGPECRRRHWTRQDRNRLEHEVASAEIDLEDLSVLEILQRVAELPRQRMRTRLGYVLNKHSRSIEPFHRSALTKALQQGTYDVLAPLLVECLEAHRQLFAAYQGDSEVDWSDTVRRHSMAILALENHLVPDEGRQEKKRIKPTGKTLDIIRAIQANKDNDRIVAETGPTIGNVRKVRSLYNNDRYEI